MASWHEARTEQIIGAAIKFHRRLGPVFLGRCTEGPQLRQDNTRTYAGHRSLTYFLHSWLPHSDPSKFSRVRPVNRVSLVERETDVRAGSSGERVGFRGWDEGAEQSAVVTLLLTGTGERASFQNETGGKERDKSAMSISNAGGGAEEICGQECRPHGPLLGGLRPDRPEIPGGDRGPLADASGWYEDGRQLAIEEVVGMPR